MYLGFFLKISLLDFKKKIVEMGILRCPRLVSDSRVFTEDRDDLELVILLSAGMMGKPYQFLWCWRWNSRPCVLSKHAID